MHGGTATCRASSLIWVTGILHQAMTHDGKPELQQNHAVAFSLLSGRRAGQFQMTKHSSEHSCSGAQSSAQPISRQAAWANDNMQTSTKERSTAS